MSSTHRTEARTRTGTQTQPRLSRSTGMQRSRCPVLLVLMMLVLSSHCVSSQPDPDLNQDLNQDLNLELRQHRLLQRAQSAGLISQDWSKRAVEDLLAQMSLPDSRRDADPVSTVTGGKTPLERSVDPNQNIPPRERKAGCKNFYWKGFTSC